MKNLNPKNGQWGKVDISTMILMYENTTMKPIIWSAN